MTVAAAETTRSETEEMNAVVDRIEVTKKDATGATVGEEAEQEEAAAKNRHHHRAEVQAVGKRHLAAAAARHLAAETVQAEVPGKHHHLAAEPAEAVVASVHHHLQERLSLHPHRLSRQRQHQRQHQSNLAEEADGTKLHLAWHLVRQPQELQLPAFQFSQ